MAAPSYVFQSSPSGTANISQSHQHAKNVTNEVVSVIATMEEIPVQTGIELGAECVEIRADGNAYGPGGTTSIAVDGSSGSFSQQRPPPLGIPETSYSSSEDEDFYDASENMGQSPTLPS